MTSSVHSFTSWLNDLWLAHPVEEFVFITHAVRREVHLNSGLPILLLLFLFVIFAPLKQICELLEEVHVVLLLVNHNHVLRLYLLRLHLQLLLLKYV